MVSVIAAGAKILSDHLTLNGDATYSGTLGSLGISDEHAALLLQNDCKTLAFCSVVGAVLMVAAKFGISHFAKNEEKPAAAPVASQPPKADRSKHKEPEKPSTDELFERANKAIDELEMLGKEAEALENPAKLMENAAASKPDSLATMIAKICAHDISTLDTGLDIVELFLRNRDKQRWTRQYIDSLILVARAFFGEIKNTSDLPNFSSFDEKEKLHRAAMVTNGLVMIFMNMGCSPNEGRPLPSAIERLRLKAEAADPLEEIEQ
ncbi:MAG: hypothetical protein WC624_05365 [Candidatus Margulisiibacteriota bacterium]